MDAELINAPEGPPGLPPLRMRPNFESWCPAIRARRKVCALQQRLGAHVRVRSSNAERLPSPRGRSTFSTGHSGAPRCHRHTAIVCVEQQRWFRRICEVGWGAGPPAVSQAHHEAQRQPRALPRRSVILRFQRAPRSHNGYPRLPVVPHETSGDRVDRVPRQTRLISIISIVSASFHVPHALQQRTFPASCRYAIPWHCGPPLRCVGRGRPCRRFSVSDYPT
jgi:hypothetical protein